MTQDGGLQSCNDCSSSMFNGFNWFIKTEESVERHIRCKTYCRSLGKLVCENSENLDLETVFYTIAYYRSPMASAANVKDALIKTAIKDNGENICQVMK